MKHIGSIAARELRSMFATPVAYGVLTLYAVLSGFFFFFYLENFFSQLQLVQATGQLQKLEAINLNAYVITQAFSDCAFLFLLIVPLLTMRTYAEERANGTIELLLTSPITSGELVIAKYLGVLALVTMLVGISAIYPALLFLFGNPELLPTLAGLLGLFLYGALLAALGCFMSTLTRSQTVAAVFSIVAGIALLVLAQIAGFLRSDAVEAVPALRQLSEVIDLEALATVLEYLSALTHFEPMIYGYVSTDDLAYYVLLSVLLLFLSRQSIESLRWRSGGMGLAAMAGLVLLGFGLLSVVTFNPWLVLPQVLTGAGLLVYSASTQWDQIRARMGDEVGRRTLWIGSNALIQTVAVAAILAVAGYLNHLFVVRWDATEAGSFSLSLASKETLKQIPEDKNVEVYAFFSDPENARGVLEGYRNESDRLSYRVINARAEPLLARKFEVTGDNVLIMCLGPCAEATQTARATQLTEEKITEGIRSVISERRKVYFLAGHDEADPTSTAPDGLSGIAAALSAENIQYDSLLLAKTEQVPADADALVLAGPSFSLFPKEVELLDAYLQGGGSLLVLADALREAKLTEPLRKWSVELGQDVIVDYRSPEPVLPLVSDYGKHPITEKMRALTIFSLARSVSPTPDAGPGVSVLASTGSDSWAVKEPVGDQVRVDEKRDRKGPIPLAVARSFGGAGETVHGIPVPGSDPKTEGRLVVVGDVDFVRNSLVTEGGNQDLFLNMLSWLIGEEDFITVERKLPRASRAALDVVDRQVLSYIGVFLLPEALLLLGIVSWWRRRKS